MITSMRADRNVAMEMRDGTILRCDIYRPNQDGKYPAIITRTPYDKLLRKNSVYIDAIDAVYAGYAWVIQDTRGRFASGGEFQIGEHVTPQGMNDAYDTVEWIASQTWCDGNIGMIGTSYEGGVLWPAAVISPPHLKAIAPDVAPCGILFEPALTGGPPYLAFLANWILQLSQDFADKLEKKGQDVSDMRRMIAKGFQDPTEMLNFLPLKDNPYFNFPIMRDYWNATVGGFNPPKAYEALIFWPFSLVKVPVLNTGGWFDINSWSTIKNFTGMRQSGGSDFAKTHQHLLMGPWQHISQPNTYLGDMDFGTASQVGGFSYGPGAQASAHHLAFFDKYLKGLDIAIPAILYFTMGEKRWHTAEEWPLPGTEHQRFFLHSQGHANTAAGDGTLSHHGPHSENPDSYVYDPLNPVPTTGGRHHPWGFMPGPRDQIHIERRGDVLCFTTASLNNDVEVTGELLLHLFAATSAKDTDFMAQLVDVFPNGQALNIADGCIRARFRKSIFIDDAALVVPEEVNEYKINLGVTSHLFRMGHHIRLDITSSSFPGYTRNMNTGNNPWEDSIAVKAKQTIYHNQGYASYIDLPVISRK